MKRISKRDRQRHFRRMQALDRRRRRNGIRKAVRRRERVRRRLIQPILRPRAIRIVAPEIFSIEVDQHRALLLPFLEELRWHFKNSQGRTILIDFSRTERFVAHGTLLFYSELERLVGYAADSVRVRCTHAGNLRASQVLKQIGVFGLCSQQSQIKPTREDVVHWRVAKGHMVDNTICAPALEAYDGQVAGPLLDGIFSGLGEAMTNAKHHAYIDVRQDGLNFTPPQHDWWMFSQARDGRLSVAFCDLGVGIPATLPLKKPSLFQRLVTLGRATSDSACIEEAIEDSRSRTNLPERGRGLGNIVNAASTSDDGMVTVMSNRGSYIMRNGSFTTYDYRRSILGTLIYWRIPFN